MWNHLIVKSMCKHLEKPCIRKNQLFDKARKYILIISYKLT